MFQWFTDRSSDVRTVATLCLAAERHSRRDGQAEPGAEHFLLAALDLPEGSARRAFVRIGADPDAFEAAIADQYDDALHRVGLDPERAPPPLEPPKPGLLFRAAPSGQPIFKQIAALRKGTKQRLAGAHVVAVVAGAGHGVVAWALSVMAVDRESLREAALAEAETKRHP